MTAYQARGRRDFLCAVSCAALLDAAPGRARSAQDDTGVSGQFRPDLELELRAVADQVSIFRGPPTGVWRYRATVLQGDAESVTQLPESYLGPVIRVRRGTRIRVHFINQLPQPSVVHWHGLLVPEAMDGHPRHAVPPGGRYVYEFEVRNRAGTYWFHPHPHELTGPQVYGGLAGLFIVTDEEERALGLPDAARDVALVIQDRSFDRDNQLRYVGSGAGMGGMMGRMTGFLGDQILVNGRLDYSFLAERRAYRLRLLNGSNSRLYKLAWHDGTPMTVIGTDGGLLAAPAQRPYVTLAPAERIELWVDFSGRAAGEELSLQNLPFSAQGGGARFPVLKVRVGPGAAVAGKLPEQLVRIAPLRPEQVGKLQNPRTIHVTAGGMRWGLNGRLFEMNSVASDEVVSLGATEVWQFVNEASMGMMGGMPHPMHIHGVQFRILDRRVHPSAVAAWRSLKEGFVDDGWKDTVLVMPGERVRLLLRFSDYPGMFLYHCHNLEHEDMGMMRNFLIKA
jgi:FtsP/CotA-like multicopper oxidase with cupredoxin domain